MEETAVMPAVEVTVDTHRTSNVTGKDVTEYSVCARTVRPAQQGQAADRCLSWHRYTDFRVLHDQCADALGLDRWFPCPKALIFTDAQRQERADELHAYLQGCVAAAGDALPPALHAFLFTPTKGSTSKRSQSIADASPFVTASPFLLHPATETVAEIVTEEEEPEEEEPKEEPGLLAAKALAFDEAAVGTAEGPGAEDKMQQLAAGLAKAEAVAAAHAEVAVATKAGANADRMRHLASGAAKAEAQAAAQAVTAAAVKADEDADKMQQLAAAAAKAEARAAAQAQATVAAKAEADADRMQRLAAAAAKAEAVAAAQTEMAAAAKVEADADDVRLAAATVAAAAVAAAAEEAEAEAAMVAAEAEAEAAMVAAAAAEEEAEAATVAAEAAEAEAELAVAENAEAEEEEAEAEVEVEAARSTHTIGAPNSASPKRTGSPVARTHQDPQLQKLQSGAEPGAAPKAWWARCCAPLSDTFHVMVAAAKADMLAANSAALTPQPPAAAARR